MRRAPRRLIMRFVVALLLVAVLAGCFEQPVQLVNCKDKSLQSVQLFLAPGPALETVVPPGGSVRFGDFNEAFLSDSAHPFLSAPLEPGLKIEGEVLVELWVRSGGAPAPVVIGGQPQEGYHMFNQFGSDRTLQPSYAVEYADAAPQPDTVYHYLEVFPMPAGGFVVEQGDRVRLLLTSLVTSFGTDRGLEVLVGEDTPSSVRFQARCYPQRNWQQISTDGAEVSLAGNQGLLLGAFPPTEGFNQFTFPFTLNPQTDRLTIELRQGADSNPVKDDMDLELLDAAGNAFYSIGSPHADETGILWRDNLNAFMPPGEYAVRVNSYSGMRYQGTLTVLQEKS
jgi:hypothetical protein